MKRKCFLEYDPQNLALQSQTGREYRSEQKVIIRPHRSLFNLIEFATLYPCVSTIFK